MVLFTAVPPPSPITYLPTLQPTVAFLQASITNNYDGSASGALFPDSAVCGGAGYLIQMNSGVCLLPLRFIQCYLRNSKYEHHKLHCFFEALHIDTFLQTGTCNIVR